MQQAAAPVLHLRDMNPFVGTTFGDWPRRHGLLASIPRQLAPAPLHQPLAGTSAFGMSGVNAHAIFEWTEAAQEGLTPSAGGEKFWERVGGGGPLQIGQVLPENMSALPHNGCHPGS